MGRYTDIAQTLNKYFNQFCPAYAKGTIPRDKKRTYLTYTIEESTNFEDNIMQVMVYSQSKSIKEVAEIVDKIGEDIGNGIIITVSDLSFTSIYLRKGQPFAQHFNDDDTEMCCYMNIITKIL